MATEAELVIKPLTLVHLKISLHIVKTFLYIFNFFFVQKIEQQLYIRS